MRSVARPQGDVLAFIRAGLVLGGLLSLCGCAHSGEIQMIKYDPRYRACGLRAPSSAENADLVSMAGTILSIRDEASVDGSVRIVLVARNGALEKLYFGSLYTIPSPPPARIAAYDAIAHSRAGDCVRIDGSRMPDGRVWLDHFVNLDRK